MYNSLVHDNHLLSSIEKFQYLKSYLTSDAAATIGNYQLSGDLYEIAYRALRDRYNNQRRLAQFCIDKLLDFSKQSHTNSGHLQQFLTSHTTATNSFKALNLSDPLDYVLLHLSIRNLDQTTRKAFEKQCQSQQIPTLQCLISFVSEASKTQKLMPPMYSELHLKRTRSTLFTHREGLQKPYV